MATGIKITSLGPIGANVSYTTLVPVVNMAGTPTTEKATVQVIGNLILSGAGGSYFPPVAQAVLAQSVTNAAQPNITSVGTLTSLTVSGNVTTGNVGAGNANITGTVYTNGISSTGIASLTTLNVSTTANLGAVSNVRITGGSAGQKLTTDGAGNLTWTDDANSSYGNSNVAAYLPTYTGNVGAGNINVTGLTSLGAVGNVIITGGSNGQVLTTNGSGNLSWTTASGTGSELVNGDNSFALQSDGNVVLSGTEGGVNRGLVWDYGAVANGVNSEIRQDINGITVRAWTEAGGPGALYAAPVNIVTNQDANAKTWMFDGQGNLTVPSGSINSTNDGGDLGAYITLTPDLGLARLAGRQALSNINYTNTSWISATYAGTQIDFTDAPDLVTFFTDNQFNVGVNQTFSINGDEPVPFTGYTIGVSNAVTVYTSVTADPDPTTVTSIDFYYQLESYVAVDYDNGTLNVNATGLTINIDNDQTSGPDINLRSGDDITLQAKDKDLGSESEGGDINIYAGDGADDDGLGNTSSTGGDIQIIAGNGGDGNSSSGSTGGFTAISGGLGGAAGVTNAAGPGGYVSISGGDGGNDGGNTSLGAGGGNVYITAGLSTQEGVNGPNVFIGSGQGGPNALAGSVVISTPASVEGPGGDWVFDGNGNLTLPEGGTIHETSIPFGGLSGNTIALKPAGGSNADQQLLVYPTAGQDFNHLHLTSGNLYNTELFLGDDNFNVKLANTGNIVINANDNTGNAASWTFGSDGVMTIPGEIASLVSPQVGSELSIATNESGGLVGYSSQALSVTYDANIISTFAVGSTITWQDNTTATITQIDNYAPTYIDIFWDTPKTGNLFPITLKTSDYAPATTANADIIVGSNTWTFSNTGNLTLPGNTFAVNYANGAPVNLNSVDFSNVASNILPSNNNTYNLGSNTNSWQKVWVSDGVESTSNVLNLSTATANVGLTMSTQSAFVVKPTILEANGYPWIVAKSNGPGAEMSYTNASSVDDFYAPNVYSSSIYVNSNGFGIDLDYNNPNGVTSWTFTKNPISNEAAILMPGSTSIETDNGRTVLFSYGGGPGPEMAYANADSYANIGNANVMYNSVYVGQGGFFIDVDYNEVVGYKGWAFTNTGEFVFPDNTIQTTAAVSYDQSLNTTDNVEFAELSIPGANGMIYTNTIGAQIGNTFTIDTYAATGDYLFKPQEFVVPNGVVIKPADGVSAGLEIYSKTYNQFRVNDTFSYSLIKQEAYSVALMVDYNAQTGPRSTWLFDTDGLTFPDGEIQTTAYKRNESVKFQNSGSGVEVLNCGVVNDYATTFRYANVTGNFTANLTNLNFETATSTLNRALSVSVIITQGATPYVCNAVQIEGVAQTVLWQGSASAPTGNANKTDIITFSIIRTGSGTTDYIVFGQLVSFG